MSVVAIRSAVKSIVDTVATAQSLPSSSTYLRHPVVLTASPAIVVMVDSYEEDFVDTVDNTLDVDLVVRILHTHRDQNEDEAVETRIWTIADALLDAFRSSANSTLDGAAYYLKTVSGKEVLSGEMGDVKVLYHDIILRAKALKSSL